MCDYVTYSKSLSESTRLYFITVKDMARGNPRRQKANFVHDLLKRDSDHYLIVREKNKINDGYHFHAVFSARNEHVSCEWRRKGVHIQVKKLGDLNKRDPDFPHTQILWAHDQDLKEADIKDRGEIVVMASNMVASAKARVRAKTNKEGHVGRCVTYMMKEMPENPQLYVNYIYVKDGKVVKPQVIAEEPSLPKYVY